MGSLGVTVFHAASIGLCPGPGPGLASQDRWNWYSELEGGTVFSFLVMWIGGCAVRLVV